MTAQDRSPGLVQTTCCTHTRTLTEDPEITGTKYGAPRRGTKYGAPSLEFIIMVGKSKLKSNLNKIKG